MKAQFAILLVVSLSLANSGNSLKCYTCEPCKDNGQSKECSGKGIKEFLCQKTTLKGIVTSRSCIPKTAKMKVGCENTNGGEMCLCDSDNCNGNGAGSLQNAMVLTMAAAAFVAAKVAFL